MLSIFIKKIMIFINPTAYSLLISTPQLQCISVHHQHHHHLFIA